MFQSISFHRNMLVILILPCTKNSNELHQVWKFPYFDRDIYDEKRIVAMVANIIE